MPEFDRPDRTSFWTVVFCEITDGSGSTVEADYSYDPLGRLYEVAVVGGAARRYLWDGDAIIGEYDAAGALTRRYVHLPGSLGAPVVLYEGSGVTVTDRRFLQTDERGSVIAITHAQTGAQTAANTYSAYGEPGQRQCRPVRLYRPALAARSRPLVYAQPGV